MSKEEETVVLKERHWYSIFSHKYLSSKEVIRNYGHWEKPSEEVALSEYHKACTHHQIYDFSTTTDKELKIFGQGHMLYFFFLKWMAIMLGVMTVIVGFPNIILYGLGTWYDENVASLETTTIGNFGLVSNSSGVSQLGSLLINSQPSLSSYTSSLTGFGPTLSVGLEQALVQLARNDANVPPASIGIGKADKRQVIIAISIIDLFGCLVFFGFSLFFIVWTQQLAEKADKGVFTIKDYTIRVRNLPKEITEKELREHFEQWGEIARVDLAHAVADLIEMVKERRELQDKQDMALAILQRTAEVFPKVNEDLEVEVLNFRYDLMLVKKAIRKQQQLHGNNSVVEAFVVFREELHKEQCLAQFPVYPRLMLMFLHRFWRKFPTERLIRGRPVVVTDAPEPSDIIFENLELSKTNRNIRWAFSWLWKLLLLVSGFLLISLAPAIKSTLGAWKGGAAVEDCNSFCTYTEDAGDPKLNSTLKLLYKTCHDTGVLPNLLSCGNQTICYECFCRLSLMSGRLNDVVYCSSYKDILLLQYAATALSVIAIVVVNYALPELIHGLTEFERHQTRSSEGRSSTRAMTMMFFLNSAISIVVANMYLPGVRSALQGTAFHDFLLMGIYPDVTPDWFKNVGSTLLLAQLIAIAARTAEPVLYMLIRYFAIKGRHKSLTQRELNKCYEGPDFTLADKYGMHSGAVLVAMLYGSAMPLVFFFACISFWVCYYLEKYYLLKVCKWPVAYSSSIATFIADMLPYAALYHLIFAIWAFSYTATPQSPLVTDTVKSALSAICDGLKPVWKNTNQLSAEQMAARFAQSDCFHLILFLIICIIVLFLFSTINELVWVGKATVRLAMAGRKEFNRHVSRKVAPERSDKETDPNQDGSSMNPSSFMSRGLSAVVEEGKNERSSDPGQEPSSPKNGPRLRPGRKLIGAPDFHNAIRSKLLIGATTYRIEDAPLYKEAFKEEQEIKDEETAALEGKLRGRGKRSLLPQVTRQRRALRERAEKLANDDLSKPELRAMLEQGNRVERELPKEEKVAKKSRQLIIATAQQLEKGDIDEPLDGRPPLKHPAVLRITQDGTQEEGVQPVRKLSKQQLREQEEALYNEPDDGAISPVRGPSYLGGGELDWDEGGPEFGSKEGGGGLGSGGARGSKSKVDEHYIAYTKEANEIFGRL